VRLVVGAVNVLAVPTGGEVMDSHDTGGAGLAWEVGGLEAASEDCFEAGVCETSIGLVAG